MDELANNVCAATGAESVELGEPIQELWSGYGVIKRAQLWMATEEKNGPPVAVPVIIKHIDLSHAHANHRGWSGDVAHQRKVRSYEVEASFYLSYSPRCLEACRVPRLIAVQQNEDDCGWLIILEDLDTSGFPNRRMDVTRQELHACLGWLANFHARFLHDPGDDLWPIGTYWHLDTRPDEFEALPDGPLKEAAGLIDQRLNEAKFLTLVHGDAKVSNFCFGHAESNQVAAVDFQYVGRGCGIKDVAYLISSCLAEKQAAEQEDVHLDFYFQRLRDAITQHHPSIDVNALEKEWRELFAFAWADFCRFLYGWSPGHWKLNSYSQRLTQAAITALNDN